MDLAFKKIIESVKVLIPKKRAEVYTFALLVVNV
jgi:hypothetical protein